MIDYGLGEHLSLHLLFSFLLLIEGMTRINTAVNLGHYLDFSGIDDELFPPIVLLITAMGESVFGLCGIMYSLHGLLVRTPSSLTTKFLIAVEIILGWPVLLVWVVVLNAYDAAVDVKGVGGGIDDDEMDSIFIISIFGGIGLCASLQGGQVYFAFNCLAEIEDKSDARARSSSLIGRLAYYLALFTIFATATLAGGGYFFSNLEGERVGCPPFFYSYPEIYIATGTYMVVVALVGWVRVAGRVAGVGGEGGLGGRYLLVGLLMFSYFLYLCLHVVVQVGLFTGPPGMLTPTGPLTVLGFAVNFMPGYLDFQLHKLEK